jgi:hypothetical protein
VKGAGYVVGLAARRLGRRDGGALVAALGITAAAAVLALIVAGTTVAKDRAVAQDVDRLPAATRCGSASPQDLRTIGVASTAPRATRSLPCRRETQPRSCSSAKAPSAARSSGSPQSTA